MEDEGSAHAERTPEEAGFEDHVVSRGSLPGPRSRRSLRVVGRPVVLSEHECGEVDFMSKLEETLQCGGSWIEGRRPRVYVRDVLETTGQCQQQIRLLS